MYRLKESGIGKKWCGDEIIILTNELSQRKLKKLFSRNCEFVEYYEKETTSEETETSASTAKKAKSNKGNGSNNRRKRNSRKRAEE